MTITTVLVNNSYNSSEEGCPKPDQILYHSLIGVDLAVPQWEALATTVVLSLIIILTIVGNILVILSVFTYKPLRIVQNFFIVSLACADLTVAILVLPFNVAYSILGRWEFGIIICKMWLTCDVLCCTSSILNLCVIATDRYWAITDPINYAQKRTLERVLLLIAGVWILSLIISSPPLIGWNDWPEDFKSDYPCQLTSNRGYVIYSSLGSFFIPLIIMTIVYFEIYLATKRRLRERARASKMNAMSVVNSNTNFNKGGEHQQEKERQIDQESLSSDNNNNHHNSDNENKSNKMALIKSKNLEKRRKRESKKQEKLERLRRKESQLEAYGVTEDSVTDNNNNEDDGRVEGATSNNSNNSSMPDSDSGDKQPKPKSAEKRQRPRRGKGGVSRGGAPTVYQFIEEKQKISLSKERRAARTLGIIMGVFVVCWVPFFLMYVILPFCSKCCPSDKLINFVTWLGYINSALNPIIYTIFNLDYRRAFKKLLGIRI